MGNILILGSFCQSPPGSFNLCRGGKDRRRPSLLTREHTRRHSLLKCPLVREKDPESHRALPQAARHSSWVPRRSPPTATGVSTGSGKARASEGEAARSPVDLERTGGRGRTTWPQMAQPSLGSPVQLWQLSLSDSYL